MTCEMLRKKSGMQIALNDHLKQVKIYLCPLCNWANNFIDFPATSFCSYMTSGLEAKWTFLAVVLLNSYTYVYIRGLRNLWF